MHKLNIFLLSKIEALKDAVVVYMYKVAEHQTVVQLLNKRDT